MTRLLDWLVVAVFDLLARLVNRDPTHPGGTL